MRQSLSDPWNRRSMLQSLGAAGFAAALPARLLRAAESLRFGADPFSLGVASGYPSFNSVVLWTRLAPAPLEPGGGMPRDAVVPVTWELAADQQMRKIVQKGTHYATAEEAHSVHVEPTDLGPGRDYWYRFQAGRMQSPVGRTRTAPAPDTANPRMRIAVASCQQYEHGYYGAYRHMLADDLDLILHLGDYIYELSWGNQHVRHHASPEAYTLDDYRTRHALYRSDRDLQAAHAAYPWLLTWDDHEVDNDYAGAISEEDDSPELFLTRRAGAYRAFYEHMPLPRRAVSFGSHLRLYANRGFGQLLNIFMLDTRQYRAPHACAPPGRRGASAANCPELYDPARSKLGATQEQWLAARMTASRTRWNLFGQGTVMAYVDEQAGQGERFWTDGWNGYPAARGRFIDTVVRTRVSNPVILSGDIHAFLVANHHRVPQDRSSPMVASEFVTTSISSQGLAQRTLDERRAENPNLLFASSERRGYVRLDVTPERLQADLMAMESVARADAGHFVQASFFVEDGRPGPIAADSGTR